MTTRDDIQVESTRALVRWTELREAGVIDPEAPSPFAPDWRKPLSVEFTPRERLEIRLRLGIGATDA